MKPLRRLNPWREREGGRESSKGGGGALREWHVSKVRRQGAPRVPSRVLDFTVNTVCPLIARCIACVQHIGELVFILSGQMDRPRTGSLTLLQFLQLVLV